MKNNYLSRLLAIIACLGVSVSLSFAQTLEVTAPMSVAGTYTAAGAAFGGVGETFSGEIVAVTDVDGLTTACMGVDNSVADVTGKIALIDRGACAFSQKVANAEAAGAIAVILCNTDPDVVFSAPAACDVSPGIPTAMINGTDCATLRMETGVMATFTGATLENPNEYYNTAAPITEGTYTVDMLTGNGSLYGVPQGLYYTYTATADGVLNVSTCGSGATTFLTYWTCAIGVISQNFDQCDDGAGGVAGSDGSILVEEGDLVIFSFDAIFGTDGFDFTVELQSLPTVPLTFSVNMEQETVSPDGVNMIYNINNGVEAIVALTDNGDGTWSGTVDMTSLDEILYTFCNGIPSVDNCEDVPDECGTDPGGTLGNVRSFVNTSIVGGALAPVCYGLCTNCPSVNVTYTVDMTNETVSPDGVNMLVGAPGVTDPADVDILPLTDNGDGTWSVTATRMTGDTLGYAFMNGTLDPMDLSNVEVVPDECGLPSGFGFNIRPQIVEGFDDITLDPVCFGTCSSFCPTEGCETQATIVDNIDGYTLGEDVTTQSANWVLWPAAGVIGGEVSDEQAASAPYSVKLEGGGSQGNNDLVDPLFNLGGESTGAWDIRFKMYVPVDGSGYYNIQNNEGADPTQWNLEVGFETDGTLGVDVTGTYPQGEWFDIVNIIDIDNQRAELIVDGQSVYTYTYGPDWSIGALNFFPRTATELYYVDDFVMRPIEINGGDCPPGSIICDGFESYEDGPISDQSANWAPWTSSPADDGVVTEELAFEGCNSLLISDEDPDDQLLLLGDRTEGNYLLEWRMYIPDGELGYFNFQKIQDDPGGEFGAQFTFNADGTVDVDAGGTDAFSFDWTTDTWHLFQFLLDVDNDIVIFNLNGEQIATYAVSDRATNAATGLKQLGAVDFFGADDVLYYIDNVLFVELPAVPGNACAGAVDIQDNLGGGQGNTISTGPYDNTDYTSTDADPDFGWECFGEPDGTGGAPSLERTRWFTFVGDGEEYFIEAIECGDDPIDFSDTQMAIYTGDCDNLESVLCIDDGPNTDGPAGFYPAGDTLLTVEGQVYYVMIDGFGPDFPADGEFCMEFTQLSEDIQLTTVTFQVDATLLVNDGELAADGIFLAGGFNGFSGEPMNEGADNIWTLSLDIEPGTYSYKFQNGQGNFEGIDISIGENCTVGGYNDREVVVEDMAITTDLVCYSYCVTCDMVNSTDNETLQSSIDVFPNPAKDVLNVQIDLPEAAENLSIRLVNAFGQVVSNQYLGQLQSDNIELDLSKVPAGAYMLQVRDGQSQFTQSVIVQK